MLKDISLDEIFDFVSEQEFEAFEHACFRAETVEKKRSEEAVLQAKRRRSRPRKAVRVEASSTSGEEETSVKSASRDEEPVAVASTQASVPVGRSGRPRPNYSHFYLKQPGRQQGAKQQSPQSHVKAAGRPDDATFVTTSSFLCSSRSLNCHL